jgi:hypothetical protein
MIKKLLVGTTILISASLLIYSCQKSTGKATALDEGGFSEDNAKAEQIYNDVQNIADEAAATNAVGSLKGGVNENTILSGCATVSHDTVSVPHTLTIDFGATNCLCADGRYRYGKIIISYLGHYADSGSSHSITFNNYHVNNNWVQGTKSVTNMGHDTSGHLYFNVVVNGSLTLANGGVRSWTCNRTRTWIAGDTTMTRLDDVYQIFGTSTLSKPNGDSFTANITTPLLIAHNCQWIKSGVIQIVPAITNTNQNIRIINYGNGTCDNQATLTINGQTIAITLP